MLATYFSYSLTKSYLTFTPHYYKINDNLYPASGLEKR